jgi:hypothetical protein
MNKRTRASGDVDDREGGLERSSTINLGSRSGFIRTPLLQSASKTDACLATPRVHCRCQKGHICVQSI